jgi:dTMP kinase
MEHVGKRGKFIVFEGIDGSGKSTQIKLLAERLRAAGITCSATREPTDGAVGALLQRCLAGTDTPGEGTLACLFAADRLDHIYNPRDGLLARVNGGETVLSDRYYLSSYAYNGAHIPSDFVVDINRLAADALRPDLNIFLDLDPAESLRRLTARGALQHYERLATLTAVREKYLAVFEQFKASENVVIIDASLSETEVADRVFERVTGLYR